MSDDAQVLSQLSAYMNSLPTRAPELVLRGTLQTVGTTRQRRSWVPTGARRVGEWRVSRAAVLAFAALGGLVVLVVLAQVFSRLPTNLPPASMPVVVTPTPTSSPTAQSTVNVVPPPPLSSIRRNAALFEVPFTYEVPAGADVSEGRRSSKFLTLHTKSFTNGATETSEPILHIGPTVSLYPTFSSGIVIASTFGALMDSCPRHIGGHTIKQGDDVPALLKDYAGFTFTTAAAFVGPLPASVTSAIDVAAPCLNHLHIGGDGQDMASTMYLDRSPSKLYFVPVGDTTVLIQIWGSTDWFPIADQIVQSIRFADEPKPTPQPTMARQSVREFEKPFSVDLPVDGSVDIGQHGLFNGHAWLITLMSAVPNGPPAAAPPTTELYDLAFDYVIITTTTDAKFHACPGPYDSPVWPALRPGEDIFQRLEAKGGMSFENTEVTIGGRSGVVSTVTAACEDHLHVHGSTETLDLARPFTRLYLIPVGDTTVVIQLAAPSETEAARWFPIAEDIVATMTFEDT